MWASNVKLKQVRVTSLMERWKEDFEELMNETTFREYKGEEEPVVRKRDQDG